MGGAGTALEYDPTLTWLNPASTARVAATAMTLAGQSGFVGGLSGSGTLVRPASFGAAALGVLYRDAGDVTLNASDGTSRTVSAARDLLFMGGLAWKAGDAVAAGASAKWIRSELAGEFRASSLVTDLGVQVEFSPSLKAGVAIKNLGPGLQYDEDRAGMPASFRFGGAYGASFGTLLPVLGAAPDRLVAVGDGEYQLENRKFFWRGGVEYWWHGLLAARLGGLAGTVASLGSVSAGGGIRFDRPESAGVKSYRLDYGVRLLTQGFDAPQTFSLTLGF